jgi:hypothetical protein
MARNTWHIRKMRVAVKHLNFKKKTLVTNIEFQIFNESVVEAKERKKSSPRFLPPTRTFKSIDTIFLLKRERFQSPFCIK